LNRFLLGSVSEEMFRTLDCPVLTVGPKVRSAPGTAGLKRILFATDLSRHSRADLILLGVRAGGPFTRAATHGRPSITHQIIRSAPYPVITVRS
jgi:nucleotide-binding universal stress UspA family protein